MKRPILPIILFIVLSFHVHGQITLDVSKKDSQLQWSGSPLLGSPHEGTLQIASGSITLSEQKLITNGKIVIDMNSLKNTDIKDEQGARDLVDHLKSEDFFAVTQYPQATFELTEMVALFPFTQIRKYSISGKLTIKGITHNIKFPATITDTPKGLQLEARFFIDRTKWNVNYNSKSVFSSLKDGIISDEIGISFKLLFAGSGC